MTFKWKAFVLAARALRATGVDHLIGRRHVGRGSIFVLHSVVPDRSIYLHESLRTSAAFLERVIVDLRAAGIDIVQLDAAIERLQQPDAAPFACFTFDDGYRDNLTVALPIFERFSAPFTVYVTTSLIERRADHWWSGLSQLLVENDRVDVPELELTIEATDLAAKTAAYRLLKRGVGEGTISPTGLHTMLTRYGVSLEAINARDALSTPELRQLASSPLVEIGAHTTNHRHLAKLDYEQAQAEVVDNKAWLEATLDRSISHFAYPFGGPESCGVRETEIVEAAGFRTAVTTRIGNLFPEHLHSPFALPRLRMFNDYESLALIRFQRLGGAGALLERSGDPVFGI